MKYLEQLRKKDKNLSLGRNDTMCETEISNYYTDFLIFIPFFLL